MRHRRPNAAPALALLASAAIAATAAPPIAAAQEPAPVERPDPASGTVVSRASGEIVRFVAEDQFRDIVVGQDLLAGDLVRTGPIGALSLLFVNRTVMRVHPNTELLVRSVSGDSATLAMESGLVWARTPRDAGGSLVVQTPSAAAAIRGTDWSLAVEPGDVSRLTVFEGSAELVNPLGSVVVPGGAAGIAAPGRAPVLVQIATLREREQMLFALTASDAGLALIRVEDDLGPRTSPPAALAGLDAGIALFRAGSFAQAASALDAAAPGLNAERAALARWLAVFARAAAGLPPAPPAPGATLADAMGRAYLAAYSGDLAAAAQALEAAGDLPPALAGGVQVALYRDRADEAERLLRRLEAVAAGSADALFAAAEFARVARGDTVAALALFRRAAAREPENPTYWNELGLAEDLSGHPLEAEAALRRAVAVAPGDLVARGNLANLLLDQERLDEARPIVEALLDADPGSYVGLGAAAQLALQEGRAGDAQDLALRALAAQPASADASILLGVTAWQAGDRVRAAQEFEAAARLDPNSPVVPAIRTAIAIDEARADDAIRAAREAERLYRLNNAAQQLAADRESGSYLVDAYSNIGLDDWARAVGDRTFDPLSAASLFSEALTPRPTISAAPAEARASDSALGSSLIQGLLLEPLAVASRVRETDFLRRPFVDAEIEGSAYLGQRDGFEGEAAVQGYAAAPVPLSFLASVDAEAIDEERANDAEDSLTFTGFVGTQPSARFGAVGLVSVGRRSEELPGTVTLPTPSDRVEDDTATAALGGTLRLAERTVLTGFALATFNRDESGADRDLFGFIPVDIDLRTFNDTQFAGFGLRSDDPGGATFAGVEAVRSAGRNRQLTSLPDFLGGTQTLDQRGKTELVGARAYVDRRFRLGGPLDAEAELGLFASKVEAGDAFPLSPRLGAGVTLAPGHRLRVAALHETTLGGPTLGPVTTLGLFPVVAPVQPGGETAAAIVRYDGLFGERLHLSLEHQSVRFEDLAFDPEDLLGGFVVDEAALHRTELTANYWVGGGMGAFASVAATRSEVKRGPGQGFGIPTVPETEGRFGFTWVHPAQVRATVQNRFVGPRAGDALGGELDPVWMTDFALAWEPLDRRVRLALEGRNLFDAEFERAFDQGIAGRTLWLSAALRF